MLETKERCMLNLTHLSFCCDSWLQKPYLISIHNLNHRASEMFVRKLRSCGFYVGEYQTQRDDDQPFLLQMKLLSSLCSAQSLQSYLLCLDGGRRGISSSTLTQRNGRNQPNGPQKPALKCIFIISCNCAARRALMFDEEQTSAVFLFLCLSCAFIRSM